MENKCPACGDLRYLNCLIFDKEKNDGSGIQYRKCDNCFNNYAWQQFFEILTEENEDDNTRRI